MQIQQKQARKQTNAQIDALTREILAVYDDARKAILVDIQKVYAQVLSGVSPDDYYNTIIKYDRLNKMLAEIDKQYIAYSIKAGRMTVESSKLAMSNAYYKNEYVLTWFTPNVGINLSFTPLPDALVEMAVTGNLTKWQELGAKAQQKIIDTFGGINAYVPQSGTLGNLLVNNRRSEILKINRSITSGLLQGNSYNESAKGVAKVIGKVSLISSTGAKANAIRIVRTESNRTYNAGAYANSQAVTEQGVQMLRIYVATLAGNTRPQSASMDGQTVGPDEPFKYPNGAESFYPGNSGVAGYDVNDRCTVIDAVDGIPPSARIGRNAEGEYETFDWTTYPEWAESQGMKQLPSGRWT